MDKLWEYWKQNKSVWIEIMVIFFVTRLILSLIGYVSVAYIPQQSYQDWKTNTIQVEHPYLSMWAVWDSQWYLKIAEHGYADSVDFHSSKFSSIGFFPLYPAAVSIANMITRDYLVAGWVVSNLFLVLSAFLLFKLVGMNGDESMAKRSLWYLFLFPSAYIFSSVYPKSMLLFFWLLSVLWAGKGIWWAAGLAGFAAAFVKPQGFMILIPLLLIYIYRQKQKGISVSRILFGQDIIYTILPIVGLAVWGLGNFAITGDLMAYSQVQQNAWGHRFMAPWTSVYLNFSNGSDYVFNCLIIIILLYILAVGYKEIPLPYWIFAFAVMIFNPLTGTVIGTWRYAASLFPLTMILASWGKNEMTDRIIVSVMAIVQGCLFVFWVAGYWLVS